MIRSGLALSVTLGSVAFVCVGGCALLEEVPVVDLGDTTGGAAAPAEPPPEKDRPSAIDPGFVGRWVGYVENPFERDELGQARPAAFPSGSTQVTLDYRLEGDNGEPAATLVFGAGPAPAPEPGVSYPPGVEHPLDAIRDPFRSAVVEGFEYQLSENVGRISGYDPGSASMLAFEELIAFEPWCEVQVPLDQGDGDFDCLGASQISGGQPCDATLADGTTVDVDCSFAAMCLSDLCRCDAEGCAFNRREAVNPLYLERQGDQLIGTISGATLAADYRGWYTPMGALRLFRAD